MTSKTSKTDVAQARKSEPTMADLLARAKKKIQKFVKGQRVSATLLSKNPGNLIFDIGGKSEGIVKEKGYTDAKEYIEGLKAGDTVEVTILVPETRDGITILGLKDAMKDVSWVEIEKAKKSGEPVPVLGKGISAPGFVVDVMGIEGFIPTSQLGKEVAGNAQNLVGKYFKAKVMEVDKMNKKVVLSEKEISEAGDIALTKEALKKIKEGDIYEGVVTTVATFGAFVKIKVNVKGKSPASAKASAGEAEVEGLVHVSELSFSRVNLPSDVVKVGDKVEVKVLASHEGKLALSIKQAKKDPWSDVEKKFKAEDKVTGKVVRASDFGYFVELTPGVEGLIHITQVPPSMKLAVGDEVKCTVEEVNAKDKRIALGLVLTSIPLGYK